MDSRAQQLKEIYGLERHVEGGFFIEAYSSPNAHEGRPLAGSIYYLLDAGEVSRLHQIDCDELWYYHEGCGMRVTALTDGEKREFLLGADVEAGERESVLIPAGSIFAAENLRPDGFTFVSCLTVPKFAHSGYRLIDKAQLRAAYPQFYDALAHLAY
jgi:hypothetical protein